MQRFEQWLGWIAIWRNAYKSGERILYLLQAIEVFLCHVIQQDIAIIKSTTHVRAQQSIGHIFVDQLTNVAQASYVVVAGSYYFSGMIVES